MTRYAKFTSYMHGDPPAGWDKKYESPMIGDNELYNHVPTDGSIYHLLEPDVTTGYASHIDCFETVYENLGLSPDVTFGLPYASPAFFNNTDMIFLTDATKFQQFNEYPYWKYYSPTTSSDEGVGNIDLNTVNSACCGSFMQVIGDYAAGGVNQITWRETALLKGIVWEFTCFPLDCFRNGVFDFSTLKEAPSHPGDQDWRLYCHVKFEIYEYLSGELEGKWNCYIDVSGIEKNILVLNDHYQGTGTTVYDDGNVIKKPPEKKDDPGGGKRPDDPINIPDLPSGDMCTAGSLRIYTLSAAQVKQVFDYLHSHDPAASVLKWWSNPMQAIISLHYLPYAIRHRGTSEEFTVLGTPTGITGFQPAEQFQEINFSYVDLEYESGTYLDMSPYTKVSIYLPGIGIRELNTDDVMGKRIWVKYQCDNATGQFVAYVAVGTKNTPETKTSVRYCFSGQVAASFPITQENWGNTYIAGASLVAGALAMGVTAGAAGAAGGGAAGAAGAEAAAGASEAGSAISAANVAGGVVSVGNSLSNLAKPSIARSGAVSGTTSLFAVKRPYLIIESPSYWEYSGEYAGVKGWPYGTYQAFKNLKGYAQIEDCHLTGITATLGELNEIESLLKQGVIF